MTRYLTQGESGILKNTIYNKGYTLARVAKQLGYKDVSGFNRAIAGDRGFGSLKLLKLYKLLDDQRLGFLLDIAFDEDPSLRNSFDIKKIDLQDSLAKKYSGLFQTYIEGLKNVFEMSDRTTQLSIVTDIEPILKKYKPGSTTE